LNWPDTPIEPATTAEGKPCVTAVPLGDRSVLVAIWRVRMGRVKLYLLDTDGVRALKALGSDPAVFHLNEGHAGFVVLQRIRDLIEAGSSFDDALEQIRRTTVFTTH